MKKKYLFLLSFFIFFSCVKDRLEKRRISVQNNSSTSIYWVRSDDGIFKCPNLNDEIGSVEADSTGKVNNLVPNWEISIGRASNQKIKIFIVPIDTINKYGWEKVFQKNKYIKVYDINMDYLDKNNWTIAYP